jgi:hypothetical protein
LAEQLFTLDEAADRPAELMLAHGALGVEFLMSGEFAAARNHLEQASPRLDSGRSGAFGPFYPCFGAWALWALGYADQALKRSGEVIASAEVLSRPAWLATALALIARLHMFVRDSHMAQETAEAAIATEHGFPYELEQATFVRGWALAEQGHLRVGVAKMRGAATALEASGSVARGAGATCRLGCELGPHSHGVIRTHPSARAGLSLRGAMFERETLLVRSPDCYCMMRERPPGNAQTWASDKPCGTSLSILTVCASEKVA